ncbi:hypothetical protein DIPPA_01535 [Diplonema papillatum]|nr:hypothetical protein DIPPA_01535 [Diplonema papillatum]
MKRGDLSAAQVDSGSSGGGPRGSGVDCTMLSGDGDYDAEGNFVGVLDEAKKKKRKVKGKKKPERVDALLEVPIEALEAGLDREARKAHPYTQRNSPAFLLGEKRPGIK